MSTNELIHPSTNPDGTCNDQTCPCHDFSQRETAQLPVEIESGDLSPSDASGAKQAVYPVGATSDTVDGEYAPGKAISDTVSDCEPEPLTLSDRDFERFTAALASNEEPSGKLKSLFRESPDSPALRRTRSIAHHWEMVEEQERRKRGNCLQCGHSDGVDLTGLCLYGINNSNIPSWPCGCYCTFPDAAPDDQTALRNLREALQDNDHALFTDAWDFAPSDIRRVTEQACAEFFYELGRRDERRLLTETANEDLGEMQRVARERLR
jgi:hypothetical protein